MTVKLMTEHHLEFLSLKGGSTGSSESTLAKMPHCWKSHVTAQIKNKDLNRPEHDILVRIANACYHHQDTKCGYRSTF